MRKHIKQNPATHGLKPQKRRGKSLARGNNGARLLRGYEKKVFRALRYYWQMVELYYTTPFMELFLQPRPKFRIPDAIVAILAGELEGGWKMEWRRQFFFMLIRLQARWSLVPHLSFAETKT